MVEGKRSTLRSWKSVWGVIKNNEFYYFREGEVRIQFLSFSHCLSLILTFSHCFFHYPHSFYLASALSFFHYLLLFLSLMLAISYFISLTLSLTLSPTFSLTLSLTLLPTFSLTLSLTLLPTNSLTISKSFCLFTVNSVSHCFSQILS